MRQQVNIVDGRPDYTALLVRSSPLMIISPTVASPLSPIWSMPIARLMLCVPQADPIAVDLVVRMVRLDPGRRLKIGQVLAHPLFWSDAERVDKIRGWKTSWRRGKDLDRRLADHPSTVRAITDGPDGWLSRLDRAVVAELQSQRHGPRRYDGRDVLDLVRAIRNISEHWFDRAAGRDAAAEAGRVAAVVALTGWAEGGEEMRRGLASAEAAGMRAAAVARYFLRGRFLELLLVFEFAKECGNA